MMCLNQQCCQAEKVKDLSWDLKKKKEGKEKRDLGANQSETSHQVQWYIECRPQIIMWCVDTLVFPLLIACDYIKAIGHKEGSHHSEGEEGMGTLGGERRLERGFVHLSRWCHWANWGGPSSQRTLTELRVLWSFNCYSLSFNNQIYNLSLSLADF